MGCVADSWFAVRVAAACDAAVAASADPTSALAFRSRDRGEDTTFEDDLAKDVLEIVSVFSARLTSRRRNRKLLDDVRRAAEGMDGAFGKLRRQLGHKARRTGALVVVADRFHPSSETCSCCRAVRAELALSHRTFRCDACGHAADRDLDAARDLEHLTASFAVTACGEERSGPAREDRVKRSP